jgi:hypothetical protein
MPQKRLVHGVSLAVAAAWLMAAAPARAQEPPPAVSAPPAATPSPAAAFGAPGSLVFTMQTADNGSGYFFFHKASGGGSSISLNPAADYFLGSSVSLGASLTFTHNSGSANIIGAGVRAGYDLSVGPGLGFWPMARAFVNHSGSTQVSIGAFAPLLWHLAPHFFLGAGPDLNVQVSGGTSSWYGIDFIIGGWI